MGQHALVPNTSRAMGMRITGTRGSGKTRLLGRLVAWSDVAAGVPTVVVDPVGALSDNVLDVATRCGKTEQERLKLRSRLVYVDVAGTGPGGHACPFPFLYRLGEDSLYAQAMRFVSVCVKTDADLRRAPILGANALTKVGVHVGMVLAALSCQLTEAEDLLAHPLRWEGRIRAALARHPTELREAAAFLLDEYPKLPARERQNQTSAYRQKLGMFADPTLRAIYGADRPGIDWDDVVRNRRCVLLDFRNVPEHQKRFAVVWTHYGLLEWIRRRGPGRHKPLSLIVDEATYLLSDAVAREDPLAEDLEELISRLARNAQVWCTYAHQELNQLNERAARLFMDLGTQLFGRTADLDAATTIARRFYRWDPKRIKKTEPIYMSDREGVFVVDERSTEYSMPEQTYLQALSLLDLPTFTFLLGVSPREGELPTSLARVSVAKHHEGQFVQEPVVAEARALLMTRHPRVADTLAEIAARTEARAEGGAPPSADQGDAGGALARSGDLSPPKLKRRTRGLPAS